MNGWVSAICWEVAYVLTTLNVKNVSFAALHYLCTACFCLMSAIAVKSILVALSAGRLLLTMS